MKKLIIAIVAFVMVFALSAKAVTLLQVPQGGTGAGTLTGVVVGNGTGAFTTNSTGNLTSDLNLDSNTLVISYDDNKVGLGTTTPAYKLDVVGSIQTDTAFYGDYWISATSNSMNIQPTGDLDDYFSFKTPAHRPTMKVEGGSRIYVESSDVNEVGLEYRKDASHSGAVIYYKTENLFGLTSQDSMVFKVCGDYDDYVKICAASNVPEMSTVGAADFKINAGGANALLLNHAGGNVAVGAASTSYILGLGTGDTFGIGTTQWNSADEIDGTKIKDADYGDVVIDAAGDWQVSEGEVDHDTLLNFVANEHLDWTGDQGATNIHSGNYTDTNTQLSEEQVEDFTGGMLGGTETHIAVTYQDITNDIDFVVSDDWWNADGDISADAISESKIAFSTACAAGNHYYLNGNDLACEANTTNTDTQDLSYDAGTDVISLVDGGSIDITEVDTDTNLTQEEVDDFVNLLLKDADSVNTRITLTYDDINNAFDFVVDDMNDDVPDAGDFGNATDLDANGALNTGSVSDNEIDYATVNMDDMTNGATNAAITLTQETNFGTAYTHSQDNTQAHSDYFLNSGSDIAGGGAGFTWTFNASAGSDSVLTFGDGIVNLTTGALQVGGAAVLTSESDPNVDTEAEIEAITGAYFGTSKAVTSGYIWVADGTDFESVVMSGDATIASGGALTISASAVEESMINALDAAGDEECLTWEAGSSQFEWQSCSAAAGDVTDVFDCSTGDCNTLTVGTSEWIIYGTGFIDANRFAGVTTVDGTEFGYLNGVTSGIQTQFDAKQGLDAQLTDLADGTLTGNFINTANPWADNEVANNITIDLATLATTLTITDNENTAENNPIVFVAGADPDGGNLGLESDGDFYYTPSTGRVYSPTFLAGTNYAIGDAVVTETELEIIDGATLSTTQINYLNSATGVTGTNTTNLVFSTSPTITTPTIATSIDLPAGAINTATEIANDIITHAQIADSDQTDTKCFYLEDPVADDDLKSIWRNSTANNFLLTEIWGESDQTVSFDLQVDDGTPADVSGTDIAPAAGEAEDTSLAGDTTLAASEELDLIITSVSGTPTWLSVCFTGNWVD